MVVGAGVNRGTPARSWLHEERGSRETAFLHAGNHKSPPRIPDGRWNEPDRLFRPAFCPDFPRASDRSGAGPSLDDFVIQEVDARNGHAGFPRGGVTPRGAVGSGGDENLAVGGDVLPKLAGEIDLIAMNMTVPDAQHVAPADADRAKEMLFGRQGSESSGSDTANEGFTFRARHRSVRDHCARKRCDWQRPDGTRRRPAPDRYWSGRADACD